MNMRHGFGERVCRAVEGAAMYGVCNACESPATEGYEISYKLHSIWQSKTKDGFGR